MPEPLTLAIVGCGQRGKSYAEYALQNPRDCKVVAIAEPRPGAQRYFTDRHHIDPSLVFTTWQDLHAASAETITTVGRRLADAVIIAVQDQMHPEVTLAFAEQGYHILCEKPMAITPQGCILMERAVKKANIIFGMGHVLRYTKYFQAISEIIQNKSLGELVNINHVEPVGHFHFAHSYVRGNWNTEEASSFALMTKCCHDIDLICHFFSSTTPSRVSSFGSLTHFRRSKKPREAGDVKRCLECPLQYDGGCPYSATTIYLDSLKSGNRSWPVSVLVDDIPDIENITEALKTGPYGVCVYESPNDVCDHQVVNFEFANGTTASLTMVAFSSAICERQTRMHFSHGEIIGDMNTFTVKDFRTGVLREHSFPHAGGHGGGDIGLMETFVKAVKERNQELLGTSIDEVVKTHMTVFAAEASRKEGRVIDCAEYEKAVKEDFEKNKLV
ncbi:hypothetical protein AGABI2DRAFT_135448 [Agaricus bisporus var. bisporus H97]|uniref:hypothetical protein n=1 Tax=Agaricus bisporus var. bisporus (strain H97 / ATCC MYA-4626 / FGSC 10389) TaxID=936046 RepID=UPI00029F7711|nr:hypothetical protein AGABI2DRAFT_135448 [Agaricus bisporus var. bisporus H97]EKV48332.1 hypothetical protein AGABI2DRAFT_135448 [Agaricus bisporus var. bisporus H97]